MMTTTGEMTPPPREIAINILQLPPYSHIKLTELDVNAIPPDATFCCLDTRIKRNICRVLFAGTLSAVGAGLIGFLPTIEGIVCGGFLSGVGNAVSTWLAWERKRDYFIEQRITCDYPLLEAKVHLIDESLYALANQLKSIYSESIENFPHDEDNPLPSVLENKALPWLWKTRNRRNFIRLFLAGAIPAAAACIGGFVPTTAGIIANGVLSGLGNSLSTWQAYEKSSEKNLRKSAIELLPKLVAIAEKEEQNLAALIQRVNTLFPEIIQRLEVPDKKNCRTNLAKKSCCLIKTRQRRNMLYVNSAGWLSGAGGWIGGFVPDTPGILVGSALGGIANTLSTWLSWEKAHDGQVENILKNEFPKLTAKILAISKRTHFLFALLQKHSDDQAGLDIVD